MKKLSLLIIFSSLLYCGHAAIKLPPLISKGMVLQRDVPLKIWGWADAGEKVNVVFSAYWSESIMKPVYVRYAWADNPEGANLINKEGLPASPFTSEK